MGNPFAKNKIKYDIDQIKVPRKTEVLWPKVSAMAPVGISKSAKVKIFAPINIPSWDCVIPFERKYNG